ncbi:outer envelope pore protein 16-4, chloroplastic-like isoform X4 [Salvia splendens]|uniref:outer envelope pore protein 16-4, chloroplastic-like isoform X4 n=1 Tax=Salvia splendens TaxID=180675 RepID=UPI001C27EA20|nr:outer envelope pore protein 16-4, chloroplastic-like isoform X4 [Salvia splendens]
MEADPVVHLPCSSIAVDSVLRLSSAGAIWGACYGPFAAKRLGLSGSYRASYIAKTVGQCGFYCGLFAAIFSFSHCGIQRYRRRNDWLVLLLGQLLVLEPGTGNKSLVLLGCLVHFFS